MRLWASPSSREHSSTKLPPSEKKFRPVFFRWLKRLAVGLAVAVVVSGIALALLARNLTDLARWAVQRSLPAAKVEIGDVRYEAPGQLVVHKFILRARSGGTELLRLEKGSVIFAFDDLQRRELGEIHLVHPTIRISPDLFRILPAGEGKGRGAALPWTVRRIVCDYADVSCSGFGPGSPDVDLKCAFDWKEPGADPAKPLQLTAWDIRVSAPGFPEPFLALDLVNVEATPRAFLDKQEISGVELSGGRLLLGAALQQILSAPQTPSPSGKPSLPWKIGRLDIRSVGVRLEDTRDIAADISFQINTTLKDLSPSQAAGSIGGEEQMVEIADVEILSPYDPFIKVLTLRRVFLRFTLGGLLRSELASVTILDPSVYVGPDLFWYMDDTQQRLAEAPKGTAGPAWKIGLLKVEYGRLLVGSGGRAKYGLPLNFRAEARDIALDNLATLKLQTAFEIPAQTYPFPSYQLEVSTQRGDLKFAYPPEKNENNLVGKVFFDKIRWRQYDATDAWLSATFDHEGINGDFGGHVYGGYLSGGFSFLFESNAPWIGWMYGKKIDLGRLTDVIAPQNFRMTGPLNFKLQMDAFGRQIERVKGDFLATRPGRMKIGKLDDFLANIPDTWNNLKKSSTRLALEALRDFDYATAGGDFWFVEKQGVLGLKLQGPLGSRNFEIVLHEDESQEGRWKQKP